MKLVQAPNPVLSSKARSINKIDKTLLDLIDDMKYTLLHASDPEGIGLAATQIGKSIQLFIIKEDKESPFFVFINPKVILLEADKPFKHTHSEKDDDHRLEGCLSLKDICGTVMRAPKVQITYMDEKGTMHNKPFEGFFATIIQHEYDHLQGILFPKRTLEQGGHLYKSHKDEKGKEIFDPIDL